MCSQMFSTFVGDQRAVPGGRGIHQLHPRVQPRRQLPLHRRHKAQDKRYVQQVSYVHPQLPLHRRHKAQDKRYLQQVSYVPLTTQPQKYVLCIHYTVSTYCVPITNMIWTSICTTCTLYKYGQRSALCTTDQLFTVFCTHFILCIHFTVHILFLLLQI